MREAMPLFAGVTFDEALDGERLSTQLARVRDFMLGHGAWCTLAQIAAVVRGSEAGVSARLRDLRKEKHGALIVERRRAEGGLWQYRVLRP